MKLMTSTGFHVVCAFLTCQMKLDGNNISVSFIAGKLEPRHSTSSPIFWTQFAEYSQAEIVY